MREHFHVPERYFLSHSVGCQPRRAQASLGAAYLEPWRKIGSDAWPGWMAELEAFREKIGWLLGAPAANMCPQINISSALTKVIYSLDKPTDRRTIVCSEADFPTIGFVFNSARRDGYDIRFVSGDVRDPQVWADAIDDTVGFVHVTHAFSNTSHLAPVTEVCQLARAAGATSIVDIAQSAGIVPINLADWACDFAIGTGVKFLCCGPGACYLYASSEMIETSEPRDVGWFSHEDPFEMDIHNFRYADSAMRFMGGTPSPAPLAIANGALDLWREIGPEQVWSQAQDHLSVLISQLPENVLVSPMEPDQRGGTLVINPADRETLRRGLEAGQIRFDERREGFRFSVHGYTSAEDIRNLLDVLQVSCQ